MHMAIALLLMDPVLNMQILTLTVLSTNTVYGSGAEEILRPTLVTVSGRCYRKLTETTFGKRKDAETLECRGKKQLFTCR